MKKRDRYGNTLAITYIVIRCNIYADQEYERFKSRRLTYRRLLRSFPSAEVRVEIISTDKVVGRKYVSIWEIERESFHEWKKVLCQHLSYLLTHDLTVVVLGI